MAAIPNGILGNLHGRLGPITGYRRNGVTVIRIATRKKDNVNSPGRLAQREKMKLCNQFTRAFNGTGFFKKTFPAHGHTGTGLSRAISALMNLAITGTHPSLSLSYPGVLISKGMLPGAANAQSTRDAQNNISFIWDNNSDTGTASPYDKVVLAAYFPEFQQTVFSIGNAVRSEGAAVLDLHGMQPFPAHTWIGFLRDDEKDAADSVWCGMV